MADDWYAPRQPLSGRAYWMALVRKQPSAVLLGVQLLAIVALPFLEPMRHGRLVFTCISFVAVTMAIWVVRSTPGLTWLALLIGFPAMVLEGWSAADSSNAFVFVLANAMLAVFYLYIAYGLIAYMFADSWVTKDELFAVAATFTVLLFAFAYLFLAIQGVYAGTFVNASPGPERSFLELLYFSAANLTGCGLSDIVAVKPQGRAATILTQLTGLLYVAMVISRLVALTAMKHK